MPPIEEVRDSPSDEDHSFIGAARYLVSSQNGGVRGEPVRHHAAGSQLQTRHADLDNPRLVVVEYRRQQFQNLLDSLES